MNALCEVVTRHIEATNRLRSENNETWWKLKESSILALSKIKDTAVEKQQAGMLQFDIVRFLDTIVLATLKDSGNKTFLILLNFFHFFFFLISSFYTYIMRNLQKHRHYFLVVVCALVVNMPI